MRHTLFTKQSFWSFRLLRWSALILYLLLTTSPMLAGAPAKPLTASPQATEAALTLINQTFASTPSPAQLLLLRSLRQLRDPALSPLYHRWAALPHPSLQTEGLLGLADLSDPPSLALDLFASLNDHPEHQVAILSKLIMTKKLPPAQAQQLIQWQTLALPVRSVLAAYLVAEQRPFTSGLLKEMQSSPHPPIVALGHLLTAERADDPSSALAQLPTPTAQSDALSDKQREAIILTLQTANRHQFKALIPWASALLTSDHLPAAHRLLALTFLLAHADPAVASERWLAAFNRSTSAFERLQMTTAALGHADVLPTTLFDHILTQDHPLLTPLAHLGLAIHRTPTQTTAPLMALVKIDHPMTNRWLATYLKTVPLDQTRPIIHALFERYQSQHAKQRGLSTTALREILSLTHHLASTALDQTADLLSDQLAAAPAPIQESMLIALSSLPTTIDPTPLIDPPTLRTDKNRALALLLFLQAHRDLSSDQQQHFSSLLTTDHLPPALRIRVAWFYLKQIGQTDHLNARP